jgi:hypothetical protein
MKMRGKPPSMKNEGNAFPGEGRKKQDETQRSKRVQ